MGSQVPGALGMAFCSARRAQVATVVPCREREGQLVSLPRGFRELASRRPPSPVKVGSSCSLREPATRLSGLVSPGARMVVRLLSRHRNSRPVIPPVSSRGISSELSKCRGHQCWGAWKSSACPE